MFFKKLIAQSNPLKCILAMLILVASQLVFNHQEAKARLRFRRKCKCITVQEAATAPKRLVEELCQVAAEDIQNKIVKYTPLEIEVRENNGIKRLTLYMPGIVPSDLNNSYLMNPLFKSLYLIEVVRHTRNRPEQIRFWEPYLNEIKDLVIDVVASKGEVALRPEWQEENFGAISEQVAEIFQRAGRKEAERQGIENFSYSTGSFTLEPVSVKLITDATPGIVHYIPATNYKIARVLKSKALFLTASSGTTVQLLGVYYYRSGSGRNTTPLRAFRVDETTSELVLP